MPDAPLNADWDRVVARVRRLVEVLNGLLGYGPCDFCSGRGFFASSYKDDEPDAICPRCKGVTPDISAPKVSFGYLGNTYGIPNTPAFKDDRLWMVFLPHPGRVGNDKDRIGFGVRTNDADGLHNIAVQLSGAIQLATWKKGFGS